MKTKTSHTPGPWFVMPDYAWLGRHPCHDARYVATSEDVEITQWDEDADPPRTWRFEDQKDSIICTMPDSENQKADARLISAAPELLACLRELTECFEDRFPTGELTMHELAKMREARAAILKTEGSDE